jgi:hypothetical protein
MWIDRIADRQGGTTPPSIAAVSRPHADDRQLPSFSYGSDCRRIPQIGVGSDRKKRSLGDPPYLPDQRVPRCTCHGEEHLGPMHNNGTFVGRFALEIDVSEATVRGGWGVVCQSG